MINIHLPLLIERSKPASKQEDLVGGLRNHEKFGITVSQ